MPRKRYKPEEIVLKLRHVDALASLGQSVSDAIRQVGVTEVTYYRGRREFSGLKGDQVRLKGAKVPATPVSHEIATMGLDLAKNDFPVHGIDETGAVIVRKLLRRSQVLAFFASLPRCLVGMEACATAHHWARELIAVGHELRLMPPQYVKAYVKRNKNVLADAETICEAVKRPSTRFVPVKTVKQRSALMMHRARDLLT